MLQLCCHGLSAIVNLAACRSIATKTVDEAIKARQSQGVTFVDSAKAIVQDYVNSQAAIILGSVDNSTILAALH